MVKFSSKKRLEFDLKYLSLIGTKITIIDSKISKQIGVCGMLVFETSNMLILDVAGREVKILKNNVILEFDYFGKALNMDARLLFNTISNRIKKIK